VLGFLCRGQFAPAKVLVDLGELHSQAIAGNLNRVDAFPSQLPCSGQTMRACYQSPSHLRRSGTSDARALPRNGA
jgi:hypothetical protein